MARIYPDPISPDTKSHAERELYGLLKDELDDTFVVIHNVAWLDKHKTHAAREGETDFIIAHPEYGVLFLEVKGGEIFLDQTTQIWTSTTRYGNEYEIKDPFHQARNGKYSIINKLNDPNSPTYQYSWPIYYAVSFPDVKVRGDLRPDAPREIIIDQSDIKDIQKSIVDIFYYWQGEQAPRGIPGRAGIESLVTLMAPNWELRSLLSMKFERERDQIKKLTESQFMVLDLLNRYHRMAVFGGAGTGKTMLAIEKANRLAKEGLNVLFLCYNHALGDWLKEIIGNNERIYTTTFHELCMNAAKWAGLPVPRGPQDQRYFNETLPDLLLNAIDLIDKRFDAIILDEGQDFKQEEWWLALESLLQNEEEGIFYVFFDDNQRIFNQLRKIPIARNFPLDINCRNTQAVHNILLQYSHATYETSCNGPSGRPPGIIPASQDEIRDKLKKAILKLVEEDGVDPSHIVILTPRNEENSILSEGDRLAIFTLTWNLDTKLKQAIRVSTIHSFKGLESPVVILTEMESVQSDEIVYVGLSRARNHVIIIGELPTPIGLEDMDQI